MNTSFITNDLDETPRFTLEECLDQLLGHQFIGGKSLNGSDKIFLMREYDAFFERSLLIYLPILLVGLKCEIKTRGLKGTLLQNILDTLQASVSREESHKGAFGMIRVNFIKLYTLVIGTQAKSLSAIKEFWHDLYQKGLEERNIVNLAGNAASFSERVLLLLLHSGNVVMHPDTFSFHAKQKRLFELMNSPDPSIRTGAVEAHRRLCQEFANSGKVG